MKKFIFLSLLINTTIAAVSQKAEVTVEANGTKIIKGFMTKQDLVSDTSFSWYAENLRGYTPESNALATFKTVKDSIHILAFGGTWCSDTKNLFPKFFAFADAAGLHQDHITVIGVDRGKKTIHHLTEAFNITRVPTFIILKNGLEIGRVVEYGKYGLFDKELGEIALDKK